MKKGFTLSEVLIALGIIGVVAAMTLPSLSTNVLKSQAGPGLMKAINTLESANMTFMHDTSSRRLYTACGTTEANIYNTYLNCIHNQLNSSLITNNSKYYVYSGAESAAYNDKQALQTKDNITYYTQFTGADNKPEYFTVDVDINGPLKGPNVLTKDVFRLKIDSYSGHVFADGSEEFNHASGLASWKNGNCDANKIDNWETCAGSIVDNGGKIIYPW